MSKPDTDTPPDGDFASYLEGKRKQAAPRSPDPWTPPATDSGTPGTKPRQTVQQVLVDGEDPTDEFLEEWIAAEALPELSDEEFERQALEAPGDDGDPQTPE